MTWGRSSDDDDAGKPLPGDEDPGRNLEDMKNKSQVNTAGGGTIWSETLAKQCVAQVLQWRMDAVDQNGLRHEDMLPLKLQKELQRKHFDHWKESSPDKVDAAQKMHKGVKHKIIREMNTRHRTHCKEMFGAREWLYIIIAIGTLDDLIIECVHEEFRQSAKAKGFEPTKAFASPQGASASSTDTRRTVTGIKHKKSLAKQLREKAKRLQKELSRENEKWQDHKGTMSWREWDRKHAQLESLWVQANAASDAAGVSYKSRSGEVRFNEQGDRSLIARALALYSARRAASGPSHT